MADTEIEFNHSFKGGRNKKRLQKTEGQGKEPVKISSFPCGVNKTKQNLCFEIKQNSVPPHLMIKLIDGTVYRARAGLRSRENGTEPPHARVSSCVSRGLPGYSFFSRNCRAALRVERQWMQSPWARLSLHNQWALLLFLKEPTPTSAKSRCTQLLYGPASWEPHDITPGGESVSLFRGRVRTARSWPAPAFRGQMGFLPTWFAFTS